MADNLLFDGCMDFLGGQNASLIPDRVPENAYYAATNVSVKRACLQPRWGFERLSPTFPAGSIPDALLNQRDYKAIFEGGKFQLMIPYNISGVDHLVIVISGVIFLYNIDNESFSIIPIDGGQLLNSRATRLNVCVAAEHLIIYDYPAYPVVITGITARRADPNLYEIPISVMGIYNQNRLFITNAGNEFTGGDPVGNLATPDAPITFEEVLAPASAYLSQAFQLPTNYNNLPITAMGFMQVTDNSTGIGSLVISTKKAIYSYRTDQPRASWQAGQFGSVLAYNAGIVGPRAIASVNSDIFYLDAQGYVRSLGMSRNEQQKWANIPISREVEIWFSKRNIELNQLSFVTYFNNKIFFSVNPYRMPVIDINTGRAISDYAFGGMVVLELDNVSSFGEAFKPTWAGLWTGVHPMEMVSVGNRCFIISKEFEYANKLYEVNPEINYDTADDKIRYVKSVIYTREHDFKDPFANKTVHSLDMNFDNLSGDFKVDVMYKPSHGAYFLDWKSFGHNAPWRSCDIPEACLINGFANQHIRDLTLGTPRSYELCSPVTNDYYHTFRKIQLRLELTGRYWELHEYRIKGILQPKTEVEIDCNSTHNDIPLCDQCFDDWLVGPFEGCNVFFNT